MPPHLLHTMCPLFCCSALFSGAEHHTHGGIPCAQAIAHLQSPLLPSSGLLFSFLSPLNVHTTSAQRTRAVPEGEESFKILQDKARSVRVCTKCCWLISTHPVAARSEKSDH